MSALRGQIRDIMAYHVEIERERSFKNDVQSTILEFLKAQADPDSASALDAAPSISHRLHDCFLLSRPGKT